VGLVAITLCLANLGQRDLWQDEGETAVLAQSVLRNGVPKALNGPNLILQRVVGFNPDYLWTFHPWGQFYLAAASLKLLGEHAWSVRLPFALCGVLCVGLVSWFAWRHWRSLGAATLSGLLLATSATFVLHCRQCRYYGLSALTCLLVVATFIELMVGRRRRWALAWGLAIAAQFYADFATLGALVPGLAASAWILKARRRQIVAAATGTALAILLCLPGLILHWDRFGAQAEEKPVYKTNLLAHLCYLDGWFIPLVFLIPAAVFFLVPALRTTGSWATPQRVAVSCTAILLLGMLTLAFVVPTPQLRYVIPFMSLAKLILGLTLMGAYHRLKSAVRSSPLAASSVAVGTAALILTSVASVPIQYLLPKSAIYLYCHTPDFCTRQRPFIRFELIGLIYELTHDFVGPDRIALNAVSDLAEPGDVVLTSYGELPLMFYRPDLCIRSPGGGAATMPRPQERPALILLTARDAPAMASYLRDLSARTPYVEIPVSVPVATYGNIPEPSVHWFSTPATSARGAILLRADLIGRRPTLLETAEESTRLWWPKRPAAVNPRR